MKGKSKHPILSELVAKSDAALSLAMESKIASSIRRKDWGVFHSWYYEDVATKKTREIDIDAGHYRKYRELGRMNNVLIECKSIRDSHILFSSSAASHSDRELPYWWIGTDDLLRQRLITELLNRNASSINIQSFLTKVKQRTYPRNFWRTYPVRIDDPPIAKRYAAFRETTIGSTRDLENSVLWKAISQLQSAIRANIVKKREGVFGDICIPLENRLRINQSVIVDMVSNYEFHVTTLYNWHPVVILEAHLWEVKKKQMLPLTHCRLFLHGNVGPCSWIDVVTLDYAVHYIRSLQTYYEKRTTT